MSRQGDPEEPPFTFDGGAAALQLVETHRLTSLSARKDRVSASAEKRAWYRIRAADTQGDAELWIFDEIGWFGITAADFVSELRSVDAKSMTLHLNSPGGDVFDGFAIYNALRSHPANVTVRVEGLGASIASVIAMAGNKVVMAERSALMIHQPWALAIGNAAEMRKQADVLDMLGTEIAKVYAAKAKTGYRQWTAAMDAETWYTAQNAVDAGLADLVDSGAAASAPAASLNTSFDELLGYWSVLRDAGAGSLSKREAEDALRDAGLSKARALALLSVVPAGREHEINEYEDLIPRLQALHETVRGLRAS